MITKNQGSSTATIPMVGRIGIDSTSDDYPEISAIPDFEWQVIAGAIGLMALQILF